VPVIVAFAVIDWIVWFSIVLNDHEGKVLEEDLPLETFLFDFYFGNSSLVVACP
jgi:hypothetical protein